MGRRARQIPVAVAALVLALLAPSCASGKAQEPAHHKPAHHKRHHPKAHAAPWNPLSEQFADAATTFLFDPAVARTQAPGNGGFLMADNGSGDVPWQSGSKVAVVPGRYRLGVQSSDVHSGYLWMPSAGLLSPTAFTIEFWSKSAIPFASLRGETPVSVSGVSFSFSGGTMTTTFSNEDSYPPETVTLAVNVRSLPAAAWENFALTYSGGQLTVYVNGQLAASRGGVSGPQVWSDVNRSTGLTIGGAVGKGAVDLAVSDLRISRVARVPRKPLGTIHSTLSVTTAYTSGKIRQSLLGGLHTLAGPATVRMARGVIRVIRTDKLINATPIKMGSPDAAYPSAGESGAFSYNWAVVDRTMEYLKHIGVTPYLSVDATPQILGGANPPFSGAQLETARSNKAPFPPQVPNNLRDWQLIVQDLANHVVNQDHIPVAYWSVWNEPDGGVFWSGTQSQYLALYQATVDGIRAAVPTAVVGGAELSHWDPQWVGALISFCASQHVPLNFVSWHYYSGDLGEIPEAQATVAALAAQYGIPRPFLTIGEWAWQLANRPTAGAIPFRYENYFLNDWSAAFMGASLIEMQRDGVTASVYTSTVGTRSAVGLMSPGAPWANFNVYLLWHMLPPRVVNTSLQADPGIFAVAAKSRHRLSTLVVSLHYQLGGHFPLTLQLPRKLAGKKVLVWLINRTHADAYDAGLRHARLHPVTRQLSRRAQLQLSLPAREVLLVQASLP